MLPAADIQFYEESGYLIVPSLYDAAEVAALRATVNGMLDGARLLDKSNDIFDLEDTHRAGSPRVRRIKAPHKHNRFFWDLIRKPRMLEVLTSLLGPHVRLQGTKINLKSAGYGAAVEWHQDWAFYPYTNDDVLAVGVMLDDFVEDNGPLMLIPGSHKGPVLDHHNAGRFCGGFNPEQLGVDVSRPVTVLAPAGSISVHHVRTIHGSALNHSGRARGLLLYEICAADAWPLAGTFAPFTDLEEFNSRMICGEPTLEPRLEKVPVRIPLPKPLDPTSIYNAQKGLQRRHFEVLSEPQPQAERAGSG
jgi:ectoine hydroxylase-related dioxygenase (phytanoyl-CoA dioxygenase family)